MYEAVCHAIDLGYRHFDTAYYYQNEKQIGDAINTKMTEGLVTREDLFLTTKVRERERVVDVDVDVDADVDVDVDVDVDQCGISLFPHGRHRK